MAQDWLKACKETIDKPEMAILAEVMQVNREEAFGWWFRVYCYADSHTADGFIPNMTLRQLASLTHVPESCCIGLASDDVRWIIQSQDDHPGLTFAKWERHNGKCAKKRAQDARRAEDYRDRQKSLKGRVKKPHLLGGA